MVVPISPVPTRGRYLDDVCAAVTVVQESDDPRETRKTEAQGRNKVAVMAGPISAGSGAAGPPNATAAGSGPGSASSSSTRMLKGVVRLEPSQIEYKKAKFLITDRPDDSHIQPYIEELQKYNVKEVVRVCEPSYDTCALMQAGITVLDLEFEDGTYPPAKVVDAWFDLLNKRFKEDPNTCIAVHCVAGLGRAPVLVALALMELGMKYEDAVDFIRQKRRGAINAKQLVFLEKYRPKSRLKLKNGQKHSCCIQ